MEGSVYNYFRDYNPSLGRYIESDPIGLFAGVNTFGYVGGNPVGNIDPLGLIVNVRLHPSFIVKNIHSMLLYDCNGK